MFKVQEFAISEFWGRREARSKFHEDVNIVIGRNGTGKTTFMNILHAVLSADSDALYDNDFKSATVKLTNGSSTRTIRVEKKDDPRLAYQVAEYQVSTRKFLLPIFGSEDPRSFTMSARRRAAEDIDKVKHELESIVSLASLSVYRISTDVDPEQRERLPKRVLSPVDYRLSRLIQKLTHYQLELSNEAREVSSQLQRDVLASLLYRKEPPGKTRDSILDFDDAKERDRLISAYKQLGVSGSDIAKRIQDHTSAISDTVNKLRDYITTERKIDFDLAPIEARKRAARVIEMSLDAEEKTKNVFSQLDLLTEILKRFIPDKKFHFVGGNLEVVASEPIALSKLSSGEKQLLILFIEALLQRQRPFVFLADEPELSLHVAWQRNIIPAIRELNPHAQVIVATHSPEIASKYRDRLVDMEDVLHG